MGIFKSTELLHFELLRKHVKLDLVIVGIVFALSEATFDGTALFMSWKKIGFLDMTNVFFFSSINPIDYLVGPRKNNLVLLCGFIKNNYHMV